MMSGSVDFGQSPGAWVALDVETTGISPARHHMTELAAICFDSAGTQQEYQLRFSRSDFSASVNRQARKGLVALLPVLKAPATIVAHNAVFDLAFVSEALRALGVATVGLNACCTLRLAHKAFPGLSSYALPRLMEAISMPHGPSHNALSDARAVIDLFRVLVHRYGSIEALWHAHGPPIRVRYWCSVPGTAP